MEQTKALNALEPYLALTKSAAAPRAAADLVTQATSNPNTYVFAELLQAPQIQSLRQSPEYAPYLSLLELFSFGTFAAFAQQADQLPPLNAAQTLKLRQLSLLTLARDPRNLSYASLQQHLGLPDARAVEDLVISAVYAGLVEAQLDPRNQAVHVSRVSPLRDLAPNSLPGLLAALHAWSDHCASTLADLEDQVARIKAEAKRRHDEKTAWEAREAKLVEDHGKLDLVLPANQGAGSGGAGGGEGTHSRNQGRYLDSAIARLRGSQRNGKRGSGSLDAAQDSDEAMDLDEEEPDDGEIFGAGASGAARKQRASRRRL
ncbi:uncharacterized protein F4812DRAFT_443635 [Daldinia caldariorum]|uniref:uncharacterized protein n=1 Tax=Daldinia caldariorum TaxID=326644 RepID=UPI0020082DAB|nr:uncharacterized protein F4812DRAFT_443635 [Daldinia caldariorum]KAI1464157.1 hypothetical protein F4812DRAFT_443635 [Daldinia caldariorum]